MIPDQALVSQNASAVFMVLTHVRTLARVTPAATPVPLPSRPLQSSAVPTLIQQCHGCLDTSPSEFLGGQLTQLSQESQNGITEVGKALQGHRVPPVADEPAQSPQCHIQPFLGHLQGWALQPSLGSPFTHPVIPGSQLDRESWEGAYSRFADKLLHQGLRPTHKASVTTLGSHSH